MTPRSVSEVGARETFLRTAPSQYRSNERVEQLLDAAAVLIDRVGVTHLTPTLVAAEARTSIGTVYRYFPDAYSIIIALGERNFRALRRLMALAMLEEHPDWRSAVVAMVRALLTAYRTIPSFRAVRTSGWLLVDVPARENGVEPTLLNDAMDALERQPHIQVTAATRDGLAMTFAVIDAMMLYAFQRSLAGEPEMVKAAVRFGLIQARSAFEEGQAS